MTPKEPNAAQRDVANEIVTFTVTCKMKRRWAEQFLGMLKHMQRLGSMGSSREIAFFSDGDGDYRPKFEYVAPLHAAEPRVVKPNGDVFFDAG